MNRWIPVLLTVAALFVLATFLKISGDGRKVGVQQDAIFTGDEDDQTVLRERHVLREPATNCNQADLYVGRNKRQVLPQNSDTPIKSHQHAVGRANAKAYFRLGDRYAFGRGAAQSHEDAEKWYQLARQQSDEDADIDHDIFETERFTVGLDCYQDGEFKVAFDEWETLARHGFTFNKTRAQFRLGEMLEIGQGVQQDFVLAYLWFSSAASQAHEEAASRRDLIVKRMTPSQLDASQFIAR
jgi:TPR repeat protein